MPVLWCGRCLLPRTASPDICTLACDRHPGCTHQILAWTCDACGTTLQIEIRHIAKMAYA